MDVQDAIKARRSIRKYERKQIPDDVLSSLLEAARLAPSSNNKQRWSMVVVTDDATKHKLVAASGNQKFVGECSAYIVAVCDPGASYSAIDIAISLDHLSLRAVELGLGTCWIGFFEADKVRDVLGIPADRDIPVCMTLGYPSAVPSARNRKKPAELFHRERWGGSA
jgi:nitroreductase